MSKRKKNVQLWIEGARLRTLPLAIAPIAIGAGASASANQFSLGLTLLALAVALFLQIGVNYANDYSDGIRGTDDKRVGPLRLTGSKSVKPQAVKNAAFIFFALAALAGLAIVLLTQHWWFLPVGAASIVAAWFYTGGKNPYGYAGLGELAVFIFFGLVATYGTAYIQIGRFDLNALLGGTATGLFASAVLMVNNIRDIDTDKHVGKRTLAVKLGKRWAKALFFAMIWLPMGLLVAYPVIYPATFFAWAVAFMLIPVTLIVATAKTPKELILALKLTSFAALGYALLFGFGLAAINFAI
ncbi:1,4-dihydroxy-2-naphthoate polyprenyltransferase [Rhodoluna sp.]|uniref:1,4-dihydroxy-2-naphthoate polyprenyltransferase n=1 Tax=Rhodoluna sp. TaxID=1969481 RepID=UPI0025FECC1C|nr:1,4-dihydroxy-2-naphthoate polyprenyltransferase [Rhodoluna sp.]